MFRYPVLCTEGSRGRKAESLSRNCSERSRRVEFFTDYALRNAGRLSALRKSALFGMPQASAADPSEGRAILYQMSLGLRQLGSL